MRDHNTLVEQVVSVIDGIEPFIQHDTLDTILESRILCFSLTSSFESKVLDHWPSVR
jgi:hypothetical protein